MPTEWKNPLKGIKERILDTSFYHLRLHYSANPFRNADWVQRHSLLYGGVDSPKWRREMELDYKAFSGQRIWPMLAFEQYFDAHIDVKDWTKFRIIDQGIRHPTVCLWVAVNRQGDRHIYREYYSTDRSISMNCRAIMALDADEKIENSYIDPATKKRGAETLKPLIEVYAENGITCETADNSFAGYDKVADAAMSTMARYSLRRNEIPAWLKKLNPSQSQLTTLASHSALTFDLRFTSRCFQECQNLRWQETKGDLSMKAESEKPMDKDDDGPDCVRYATQSELYYVKQPSGVIRIGPINFKKMDEQRRQKQEMDKIYFATKRRAYV